MSVSCRPADDNSESESDSDDRFKGERPRRPLVRVRCYSSLGAAFLTARATDPSFVFEMGSCGTGQTTEM